MTFFLTSFLKFVENIPLRTKRIGRHIGIAPPPLILNLLWRYRPFLNNPIKYFYDDTNLCIKLTSSYYNKFYYYDDTNRFGISFLSPSLLLLLPLCGLELLNFFLALKGSLIVRTGVQSRETLTESTPFLI